jgi:uncharacterized protein (TIGR02646 family)
MVAARHAVAEETERTGSAPSDPWGLPFDKAPMRQALCAEQGYLCAYCGRRIEADGADMTIEHWTPRALDAAQALVWRNLLGVCRGTYRGPRNVREETIEHCDKSRTPRMVLLHHPAELPLEQLTPFSVELKGKSPYEAGIRSEAALVAYVLEGNRVRGWLGVDSKARCNHGAACAVPTCVEHDIQELNLNALRLVNERATVISRLGLELARRSGGERAYIQTRLLAARASQAKLPSYAHIELAYLQRKARAYNLT